MSKTNFKNPMKVITGPDTRWSYANVWNPKSINGGTPKYSVRLIIPKFYTKTLAKIKAAYKEGESKLKGNGKTVPQMKSSRKKSSKHLPTTPLSNWHIIQFAIAINYQSDLKSKM